jgi:L-asparaginase/Glu-tRNA(Gln) amidotransferase subunit D
MPDNARKLQALLTENGITGKTVVFTGAIKPLANRRNTDGWGNLAYAINHLAEFGQGVHIVMHNQHFAIEGLYKDFQQQRFYIQPSI